LKRLVDHIGKFITYATLTGEWPTVEQLNEKLRALHHRDVINRIAWISALTRTWAVIRNNNADKRVREYVLPGYLDLFQAWTARFGEGFVFSRYTLLWTLRRAFMVCSPNGAAIANREALQALGEACLMANDLVSAPSHFTTCLSVAANSLPNIDYTSHEDYDRELARTRYLLTELAPQSDDPCVKDLAAGLTDLLGMPIDEYCDVAFSAAMRPLAAIPSNVPEFLVPALTLNWFRTTTIAPGSAASFLNDASYTEEEFADAIQRSNAHPSDLTIFRERPLLKDGEQFVPLDAGFLLDKAGRSLFWTALKRAPGSDREDLLRTWGTLFETYVNDLLRQCIPLRRRLIVGPQFSNQAQAFDACILEGSTLIVMEHKASTIANVVKYANDPDGLGRVLEERFVTGTDNKRKGLAQLAHSIHRFAAGDDLIDPDCGEPIQPQRVSKIIPVLLHLDNALRVPGLSHHLAQRFKSFGRVRRIVVTPLVLLPVTELEEVEGLLGEFTLSDLLESFLGQLRTDPASVFFAATLPILHGRFRVAGPTLRRFDEYLAGLGARLFGTGPGVG
jgi:hypothetical protein